MLPPPPPLVLLHVQAAHRRRMLVAALVGCVILALALGLGLGLGLKHSSKKSEWQTLQINPGSQGLPETVQLSDRPSVFQQRVVSP